MAIDRDRDDAETVTLSWRRRFAACAAAHLETANAAPPIALLTSNWPMRLPRKVSRSHSFRMPS